MCKLIKHLYLIKQNVIRLVISNLLFYILIKLVRITKLLEGIVVECHLYDVVGHDSIVFKKTLEESEQQKGFSATAHTCNDLYQPIMP